MGWLEDFEKTKLCKFMYYDEFCAQYPFLGYLRAIATVGVILFVVPFLFALTVLKIFGIER